MKVKLYTVLFLVIAILSCKSEEEKLIEKINEYPAYGRDNYNQLVKISGNEYPNLFLKVLKAQTEYLLVRNSSSPDNDKMLEMWDCIYRIQNEKSFKYIESFIEKFEYRVDKIEYEIYREKVLNGTTNFELSMYYGFMDNIFESMLWSYYTKLYRIDPEMANNYINTRIPKDNKRYNNVIKEIKSHNFDNDINNKIYSIKNLPEEFKEVLNGIKNNNEESFKLLENFTIKETTLSDNENMLDVMSAINKYSANSELISFYFILISQIEDTNIQMNFIKKSFISKNLEIRDQAGSFIIEYSNEEIKKYIRNKLESDGNKSPQLYAALYLHDLENREEILRTAYLDPWKDENRLHINLLLLDILENK